MSRITIASNEYITLEYISDKEIIFHTVHKPIGEEQVSLLKTVLNAGTDALGKYGLSKWLSDDRKTDHFQKKWLGGGLLIGISEQLIWAGNIGQM